MKRTSALLLVLLGFAAWAQPKKVNYQAVALNAAGTPVKNKVISVRLSMVDSAASGTVLYTETHQPTTDGTGQFSVYLGGGTATQGTFANIPWGNNKDKFLKAEADLSGGSSYTLMGISQVVSVPYALAAGSLNEGALLYGSNGQTYSLNIGPNGPVWTCYPPVAVANAGADQLNVCGNLVALSGNTASGITSAWSILNGTGGSTNGNTFTGTRGNAYSLRYTLTNACGSSSDTLQISLALPTTTASAGPDQISLTGTTATLAANAPAAGETGTWTIASGSGATLSNANNPAATFTKGTDSSYTLVWTIAGPCGSSRDTVKVSFQTLVMNTPCPGVASVTYAGETYPTVQIGSQCWLAKNLNVGTMINSAAAVDSQKNNGVIEKYCYNNDPANCTTYGGLYQWAEAVQYKNGASNTASPNPAFTGNIQGICPAGWHLPSDAEYCALTTFLDALANCNVFGTSSTTAGIALKSTNLWYSNVGTQGTNSSGFSALPGGSRNTFGAFYNIGGNTYFWSSSESFATGAIYRYLYYYYSNVFRYNDSKSYGFSVRCTQD
jgi:uncharacterized protein (TIGR02145 family)